jgi:uncharacterized damage-inducible protein DinB
MTWTFIKAASPKVKTACSAIAILIVSRSFPAQPMGALPMTRIRDENLLEALLNSWERNNTILLNLLHAIPEDLMGARALPESPSVAQMFAHIHYVRLIFISEDAPEFALNLSEGKGPEREWRDERDVGRMTRMLNRSARAVRDAVEARIKSGEPMNEHYDHPVLFLQHMIWHEGYHHGQIKLALKTAGQPLADAEIGPATWGVWMNKT